MEMDLKPGDVVQLNSGGPRMTVVAVQSDGTLRCTWFREDGNARQRGFCTSRPSRCQNKELRQVCCPMVTPSRCQLRRSARVGLKVTRPSP